MSLHRPPAFFLCMKWNMLHILLYQRYVNSVNFPFCSLLPGNHAPLFSCLFIVHLLSPFVMEYAVHTFVPAVCQLSGFSHFVVSYQDAMPHSAHVSSSSTCFLPFYEMEFAVHTCTPVVWQPSGFSILYSVAHAQTRFESFHSSMAQI